MFGLPVATGPHDTLRDGFKNNEHAMMTPHPVQGLDKQSELAEFNGKIERVRRVYGIHMAMRLATEEKSFGRPRRLPGLQSSHALHDTITGSGTKIDFKDFLDDPFMRATGPSVDFHRQTEAQHGLV